MTRGGRRAGAGRKADPHAARVVLHVRVTAEQRDAWQAAADLDGADLSEWVRETLDRRAERVERKVGA